MKERGGAGRERETNRQTDRQTYRYIDRQTYKLTEIEEDSKRGGERQTERERGERKRETDRETQANRQGEKEEERERGGGGGGGGLCRGLGTLPTSTMKARRIERQSGSRHVRHNRRLKRCSQPAHNLTT